MKKTMTKKINKAALLVFILLMLSTLVNSQTYVSGTISSNTTWTVLNNPYIVTGNVLLDSGYTLTIDPGVIIKFRTNKTVDLNIQYPPTTNLGGNFEVPM